MPRATRPNELSASEARRLLVAGDLTCETLVRACLERIEAREPELRAFVWLEPERALEAGRRIDRAGRPGPLHGLPVGVKDVIATADMPTQYNSPIYAGHRPGCRLRAPAEGGGSPRAGRDRGLRSASPVRPATRTIQSARPAARRAARRLRWRIG
jgi:Amidase